MFAIAQHGIHDLVTDDDDDTWTWIIARVTGWIQIIHKLKFPLILPVCHLYPVPVVGTIYVSQKLLGKFLLT